MNLVIDIWWLNVFIFQYSHSVQRGTVACLTWTLLNLPGPVGQSLEISVMFYTDFHAGFVPLNRWAYIFLFIIHVIKQRSYWIIFIGCASCWNAKLRLFMQILNVCGLKVIAQIAQIGTAPIAQIVIAQIAQILCFLLVTQYYWSKLQWNNLD